MTTTQKVVIRPPTTPKEFEPYYELRYKVLRMPLGQTDATDHNDTVNRCWHLAAFAHDAVIGVARLHVNEERQFVISWVAVDPNHRHRGVGWAIMEALHDIAKHAGASTIELTARNTARGFFRKLGYVDIGEAPPLCNLSEFKIQTGQTSMKKGL